MNKFQEFQFELLKDAEFPTVSGKEIVEDLMAHQELWSAVYVKYKWRINLYLEPERFWDLWSVYIFTVPGRAEDLETLIASWGPDNLIDAGDADHQKGLEQEPYFSYDAEILEDPHLFIEFWWDAPTFPPGTPLSYINNLEHGQKA